MKLELSEEEINIINEWLVRLSPVRVSFNLTDEYSAYLEKENTIAERHSVVEVAKSIYQLLGANNLIEPLIGVKPPRSRLTQLGIDVLKEGGWKQYQQKLDIKEKQQDEIDRLTREKLDVDLTNSKRVKILYIPATIVGIIAGLIGGIIGVYISYIKLDDSNSIRILEEKVIHLDSISKITNQRIETLSDSLKKVKHNKLPVQQN